jgi:hypothetical protein
MSVRYPEHDCFEDYEEDNIVTEKTTKEDMIKALIEHECQTMTVWDLLNYYKHNKRKEYDKMSDKGIAEIHKWFF